MGSLLGLPVELSNGIAVQMVHKTTIKLTFTSVFWQTEPNSAQQLWYVGIK